MVRYVPYVEPDAEPCEECRSPVVNGVCVNLCHEYIPTPDGSGECVNCEREQQGLPPLSRHDVAPDPWAREGGYPAVDLFCSERTTMTPHQFHEASDRPTTFRDRLRFAGSVLFGVLLLGIGPIALPTLAHWAAALALRVVGR